MFTAMRRGVASVGVFILVTSPLAAQRITGTVRAERDEAPVAGAIVVLLDARGGRLNGGLTGEDGRYELTPPAPGRYALRVDLVGYQSKNVPPFDFAGPADVVRDVRLPLARATLPAVVVTASASCGRFANDDADATRLWDEARKALEATHLAQETRRFPVTVTRTTRVVSLPDSIVRSAESTTRRGVTENPFVSLSPDSVRAFGYRTRVNGEDWYYGPDARVLLSDAFVAGHCFRTRQGTGRVGLAFSPMKRGSLVDVDGVLWLDSTTAELQALEFRFVPSGGGGVAAGGEVLFGRMPSGTFGVRAWTIRVPVLTAMSGRQRVGGARAFTQDTVATGLREERGEVLAGLTSARNGPAVARLLVTAWDSTMATPLGNATVTMVGMGESGVTAANGEAHFDSLATDGLVRVRLWHPRLDSIGVAAIVDTVRLHRGETRALGMSVPSGTTLMRGYCLEPTALLVTGVARMENGSPATDVTIRVYGAGTPLFSQSTVTDGAGRFRSCVPQRAPLRLHAASEGLLPSTALIPATTGDVVAREFLLAAARRSGGRDTSGSGEGGVGVASGSSVEPMERVTTASAQDDATIEGWIVPARGTRGRVASRNNSRLQTATDSTGTFRLTLPPGPHTVTFSAEGHVPATANVILQKGERVVLFVRLAGAVAPVVAASGAKPLGLDWTSGFEERRRRGRGRYFTREDITRMSATSMSDILRSVPGVQVIPYNAGYRFVSARARELTPQGRACDLAFYVDGRPFTVEEGNIDVEVRPAEIDAMEIYVGGSDAPQIFASSRARCGVVAVWRSRR